MTVKQQALEKMAERLFLITNINKSEFTEDSLFADLNLKSANYSQLTTYLEDAFDVEVPYMDFKRKKSLGEAADYIVQLTEA